MAKTASSMLPLGTHAPQFSLLDVVSGKTVSLNSSADAKATVIMFICNHCPYVKHVNKELSHLCSDYQNKGVRFIAINSNDIDKYPDDSPENMKKTALEQSYPFPYLYDETQEVAKAYQAACTPDFFVYDKSLKLAYRGRLDDSWKDPAQVKTQELRDALLVLLEGGTVTKNQAPSMGCSIKWRG